MIEACSTFSAILHWLLQWISEFGFVLFFRSNCLLLFCDSCCSSRASLSATMDLSQRTELSPKCENDDMATRVHVSLIAINEGS